ncbi:MAG: glutaminyl-peptide cyclotransferase [Bacteroidota bacterium]|nr:glutaminyl-peptide cyclotransferase [Bacteroidota bacterium]
MARLLYITTVFLMAVIFGCNTDSKIKSGNPAAVGESAPQKVAIVSPQQGQIVKSGEGINLKINLVDSLIHPDSVQFLVDGYRLGTIKNSKDGLIWKTREEKVGTRNIEAIVWYDAGKSANDFSRVEIRPSAPAYYSYKVLSTYHHDPAAYTQGLVYDRGTFLEGTGLYGQSTLRRVKIESGDVQKSVNLPKEIFGEGVAMVDDKIWQISWKEQTAYLYNKSTFDLIKKVNYPIAEGWGLTYDGASLIMSDGSANLYYMDKEAFTETKRIEVCDDHGPVKSLNELEYIDGEVWANIYTTDTIVRINPKTGAVTGKIDMSGLLKSADRQQNTDVLNGIAYDNQTKRLFVTGKNWPKLFQIALTPKKR